MKNLEVVCGVKSSEKVITTTITEKNKKYGATDTDVSSVYVDYEGNLTLINPTITKSGDTSSSNASSSTGLNAAVWAKGASTVTISDGTVTTDAVGGNGVFAADLGTAVTLSDLTIETSADYAHGVDAVNGALITLNNVTVTTEGAHCSAIATDAGRGNATTLVVAGGTFVANGEGSAAIYCDGDGVVTVSDATATATNDNGAVIDRNGILSLSNTVLVGSVNGIMVHDSESSTRTAIISIDGGSVTGQGGAGILITGTGMTAEVTVTGGAVISGSNDTIIEAAEDGQAIFTADGETLAGNLVSDNTSLTAVLQNGTILTGCINGENTASAINLTLDETSTWSVTGTSYLTTFTDADTSLANIDDNGYTIYYDSSLSANSWLDSKTYTLTDGGKLAPTFAAYYQSGGSETLEDKAFIATEPDEYGIYVTDGGTLTLSNSTVTTSGDSSSEDDSSFYGLNAGILAKAASTINLSNCAVSTSGLGANGVFATDSGSTVNLTNVTIDCTGILGHGVDATYEGVLNLNNVTITTAGRSSAAIATDRGGGTVNVSGGTMNTSGEGSPGIYSTGAITIDGATITAIGSEGAVIEGLNSITLTDTVLSGAKKCGAMIYQSFSGDAEVGTGTFTMTGGSLAAEVGPLFYSTNTTAVINLTGVSAAAASGTVLKTSADSWGTEGENGADVTFTADSQTLSGDVVADSISTITLILQNNSSLTGTINGENTASAINLTLDETSTWSVTGTSYLTTFTDADTSLANIDDNGYTIYYDSSLSANSWLDSKTYTLTDGGKLAPTFAAYYQSGGSETLEDKAFIATEPDEYGIYVTDGGTLTLSNSTVTTSGDSSSEDDSSFYGLNAGILASAASIINLSNCSVSTSGLGANGVFATDSGSTVNLTNVTIDCTGRLGHGVDATNAGVLNLNNVTITTAGASGAAIATDRGGGTVNVSGGTMNTSGGNSPGIYSTGAITIDGATITATGSEGAVIEGLNSITLTDTILSGAKKCGAMIYQSFSGDAEVGTGTFTMTGGSLTAEVGPLFYSTNTTAVINLTGVSAAVASGTVLKASADKWGTEGENGADVTFTANSQTLVGDVVADSVSSITLILQNNSSLTGTINGENTASAINLTLDETSTWSVTGTSYLTTFTDADTSLANIDDNGYTIYYDSSLSANSWLNAETYTLTDGGKLAPKE